MKNPTGKQIIEVIKIKHSYDILELFYKKQSLRFTDILNEIKHINHTHLSNILKGLIDIGYIYRTDKGYHIHWSGSCFYEYMES